MDDLIERASEPDTFQFYDEGWAARYDGRPFNRAATLSWRDGWKDCDEVGDAERQKIGRAI